MENIYKNLLFLSITTPLSLLNLKWKYWFTFCVCKWKQWQILLSLATKITADCGCSHEIIRCLLLRKKQYNKHSELKSRDITLPTKVHIVKSYGFSSSHGQIWEVGPSGKLTNEELMLSNCGAGELLRVPCISRRPNQSILNEINPECLLEGLMLNLKLQ